MNNNMRIGRLESYSYTNLQYSTALIDMLRRSRIPNDAGLPTTVGGRPPLGQAARLQRLHKGLTPPVAKLMKRGLPTLLLRGEPCNRLHTFLPLLLLLPSRSFSCHPSTGQDGIDELLLRWHKARLGAAFRLAPSNLLDGLERERSGLDAERCGHELRQRLPASLGQLCSVLA